MGGKIRVAILREDSDDKGQRKASVVTENLLYPDFGRGCNGTDLITIPYK